MFFHILKYRLIQLFHSRNILIWIFIFPLILGSLFYMGFGNMIIDNGNDFQSIPIAVVGQGQGNPILDEVIQSLSQGDSPMFDVTRTKEANAQKLLQKDKVDGILYEAPEPYLTVNRNDLNQSILYSFLSQYIQQAEVITRIAENHPENLEAAVSQLRSDAGYNKEVSMTRSKNTNNLTQYFYALIAMICLYGGQIGMDTLITLHPQLSSHAARKSIAPVHKLKMIAADLTASVMVNYLSVLILIFYITQILKINLGDRLVLLLLASLAGSLIGVSIGIFFGSLPHLESNTKEGFLMGFTMFCCFLGGLIVQNMPSIVEEHAPVINQINPAYLLSDCFYVLNIYQDTARWCRNVISLLILTVLFSLAAYLLIRQKTQGSSQKGE